MISNDKTFQEIKKNICAILSHCSNSAEKPECC